MVASSDRPVTDEDWSKAEALVLDYLKTEKKAADPITLRRHESTPFIFGAWWKGGTTAILVYGGKIHHERGEAALPAYFEFLGATRLRALSVDLVDGMLEALDAGRPKAANLGAAWRFSDHYKDLYPAIVDRDGVLKYVVHYAESTPRPPIGEDDDDAPPPPPGSGGGGIVEGPLVLQRWSLQLFPPVAGLHWTLEGSVERPQPPLTVR